MSSHSYRVLRNVDSKVIEDGFGKEDEEYFHECESNCSLWERVIESGAMRFTSRTGRK